MASNNTVYIIYDTAGQPITAIQPNTFDGPGGIQQSSDLTMYGLGFPTWGQGADQNDYHLVENFACPQSILNPTPVQPMGATELGAGNGINVPIVGQFWFNTTNQSMYVYTQTGSGPNTYQFKPVEGVAVAVGPAPGSPTLGQLWYNGTQLMIWNGTAFVSVAAQYLPLAGGTMTGSILMGGNNIRGITMAATPLSTDVATVGYVNTAVLSGSYVPIAGGTMTGPLNMSSAGININGGPGLTLNTGANITVNSTGILTFSARTGVAINANGGRIANVLTSSAGDAVSTTYANANYLSKTGGTMTGTITMSGGTTVTGIPSPALASDAVPMSYVEPTITKVASFPTIVTNGATVTLIRTGASGNIADPQLSVALEAGHAYNITCTFTGYSPGAGVFTGLYYNGGVGTGQWGASWNIATGGGGGFSGALSFNSQYLFGAGWDQLIVITFTGTLYTTSAGTLSLTWGNAGAGGNDMYRYAGSGIVAIQVA